MVELNPEITAKSASLEIKKTLVPEKSQEGLFDKLQLRPPMVMSTMEANSKNIMVVKMLNANASTRLSDDVTASAYATGMNNFMAVKPTTENSSIYMLSSMGSVGAKTTVKIVPDLKLYALEGIDYQTDYRGHNAQQNYLQLGVSLDKTTEDKNAGIRATAFVGRSLDYKNGAYDLTPIKGWSVDGMIKKEFGRDKTISAQAGALGYTKSETNVRALQGSLSLETPSGRISANGRVADFKSPDKTTRSYQAGLDLSTSRGKGINVFAMADSDNLGTKMKSVGLAYRDRKTTVGANVTSMSFIDSVTQETITNTDVRLNAGYTW